MMEKPILVKSRRERVYYVGLSRYCGGPEKVVKVWEPTDFLHSLHASLGSHSDYGDDSKSGWVGELVSRRAEPGIPVGTARFSWFAHRSYRQRQLCRAIIQRAGLAIWDQAGDFILRRTKNLA